MKNLLEMTYGRQKRQSSLNQHPFIVGIRLTNLEIVRIALLRMKTLIRKDDRSIRKMLDHGLEIGVMHICRGKVPANHQTQMVEQPAQLAANDPTPVGKPLSANLGIRSTFTHGVDQFNAVAVDDTQQARFDQKADGPIPVSLKEAKQSRSFGKFMEQRTIISLDPTINRPTAASFQNNNASVTISLGYK